MMFATNHNQTQNQTSQTTSAPTPATHSWRFGALSDAELMPQLQRYLLQQDANANWQLVWLNNDGCPIIGLLPKTSWSVYPAVNNEMFLSGQTAAYKVVKHSRDTDSNITTAQMSYAEWQDELIAYSQAYAANDYDTNRDDSTSYINTNKKPTYHHGLIGFIGYDIAAHELSPTSNIHLATQPCALLGHYDIYLIPNAEQTSWQLTIKDSLYDISNKDGEQKTALVTQLISYLDKLDSKLTNQSLEKPALETPYRTTPLLLKARWRKYDYEQAFNQTQNYLQQGDCYQINLTQEWHGDFENNPSDNGRLPKLINYLPDLHRNTQAPFSGYLAINHEHSALDIDVPLSQFELLSCSPELFFTFIKDTNTGKHHIITKPIKGTMPRGATAKQDDDYKQQLIASEKDRSENVMIVDLLRNDLGKYAKIGSVKVPKLFVIESFSNVHHMVSTISAELKENSHPLAVLFGSLPAGSITGTPKKRAVEIISELENKPRGAYCGTMGYMNFDGSGQWNVLIRTLQAIRQADEAAKVSLWAGGGITVASDYEAEFQECLDKVGNLLAILSQENIVNEK